MKRYLCVGDNHLTDPSVLAVLKSFGVQGTRPDLQHGTAAELDTVLTQLNSFGFESLAIAWDHTIIDQCTILPTAFELRNEPDINTNKQLSISEYAALINDAAKSADTKGVPLYVGVVANLTVGEGDNTHPRGLDYLKALMPHVPAGVRISAHRYPAGRSFDAPHAGFTSRDDETHAFLDIIKGRPFGISEFGYHQAPQHVYSGLWGKILGWFGKNPTYTRSDKEVVTAVRAEFDHWEKAGAQFACLYEINDGPRETDPESHFGIRRTDGSWKPVATAAWK